ncbi:hypothetical protein [Actinopolymorpha rutila]|uniref:Uncharacterized protein n=1 Tax=Actinopolymorpha rutila TaxID=446787 RepID=A0A852ZQ37_9ACTN|nr:hypothetical protein [Actinopolymorpha rutila]NYH91559.1 hypothetical protein [Actinopolymorpha rutila]
MDPPAGHAYALRFGRPQDNPTRVSVGMLALNLALFSAGVAVVRLGARRLRSHL